MPPAVISVEGLVKEYGSFRAVDDLSLHVDAGEVYGLLGHNGAGKSTTVEILEGHRTRTAGHVSVLGIDPGSGALDLRDRVGIVLQTSGIEDELTVIEALVIYGSCYSRHRPVDEILQLAGLTEQRNQRIGTLSGGQKRRVDLALGIVNYPEILFLDEPTTGFDPAARRSAWDVIRGLQTGGTTIVLTTHYLDEAEQLADRVGVIAAGRMVAEGTPEQLVATSSSTSVKLTLPEGVEPGELDGVLPSGAVVAGLQVSFDTETPTADMHRLTSWATQRSIELEGLSVTRPSLEDAFLSLAGEASDNRA